MYNWNSTELAIKALKSIYKNTKNDFELFLFDNGSVKEQFEALKGWVKDYPEIELTRYEENKGIVVPRNEGMKRSRADIIGLLDSDICIYERNWDKRMVNFFEKNEECGIAGSTLFPVFFDDKAEFYTHRECLRMAKRRRPVECMSVQGAFYFFKREVLEKVGLQWEPFFYYHEESDYAFRAIKKGFRVCFLPLNVSHGEDGKSTEKNDFNFDQDFKGNEGHDRIKKRNQGYLLERHCGFLAPRRKNYAEELEYLERVRGQDL